MKTVIVIGAAGQVGSGICKAFINKDWNVIAIDPKNNISSATSTTCINSVHYIKTTVEEVTEQNFQFWFFEKQCHEVCYVAEEGNRDIYSLNKSLGSENCARFAAFVKRLEKIWKFSHRCKRNEQDMPILSISYCGGSWTRREADKVNFIVSDESEVKKNGGSNDYECAKTSAHAIAKDLSAIHGDWCQITFYDYISVVPNYAPNFTVGKMVQSAMENGSILYSEGDYGRPLLHSKQAGDIVVNYAERRYSLRKEKMPTSSSKFDTILIPGHFTPFKKFACIAKEVVVGKGGKNPKEVSLATQESTPDFLRSQCISERLLSEMNFIPDGKLVEEGLRETAINALEKYKN